MMKPASSRGLLVLLLLLPSATGFAEILVESDRFTGVTKVQSKPEATENDRPRVTYLGVQRPGKAVSMALNIVSRSKSWRYLKCNGTDWLLDGQPFKLPQPRHDGTVGRGYVLEFLAIHPVSMTDIQAMAAATKIEYRICNDEYVLTEGETADLRAFAEKAAAAFANQDAAKPKQPGTGTPK